MSDPVDLPESPAASPEPGASRLRYGTASGGPWLAIALVLTVWAVWHLDVFPLAARLPVDGGGEFPRAWFTVDHPFHTARADLIRVAWSSFDTVRWVASHHGGYPAEFFPFGLPAVAAGMSILSVGTLSIEQAWALAIVAIFLLPAIGYWLLGRQDRLTPAVALIAFAGHVAIASSWTDGGFTELVEWGLATNVAGATLALIALPLMYDAVSRGSPRMVAAAAVVIALCAATNPRSLIAVSASALVVLLVADSRQPLRRRIAVLSAIAVLAASLAAPILVPLLRYNDLYFFLSYQEYGSLAEYWHDSVDTVTWPILALALSGGILAFRRRGNAGPRIAALTLLIYTLVTAIGVSSASVRELIPQLELPRLMPFQRFLTIYLAAYAVVVVGRYLARVPSRVGRARDAALAVAASLAVVLVFASDFGPFPIAEQGVRPVPKTDSANAVELVDFRSAIARADEVAAPNTAILVIGSRLSWHEQLWAPIEAPDRRFYYNDWLWYWHALHKGPYDYRMGHYYPDPSKALEAVYLEMHGIGAVVITDTQDRTTGANARVVASQAAHLDVVDTIGAWDVMTVQDPVPLASLNGVAPDSIGVSEDGETVTLGFADRLPGTVIVRQNWFPRWEATIDGRPVAVDRAPNGYMQIETDGGSFELRVTYAVVRTDTAARLATVVSAIAIAILLVAPRPTRRWARR